MASFTIKRKHMAIPYVVYMALFIIIPLIIICVYAFTDKNFHFTLANFGQFFTESESVSAFIYSVWVGLLTTAICLIIGFPIAYILSTKKFFNTGGVFIVLFILPMWINFLLRTLAIREIFSFFDLPFGELTTVIGMVYNFLPFMILPIYTVLLKMDRSYIEAAQDLGANSFRVFTKVIIPLAVPGIISGVIMVFMPCISTFVIADLLSRNTIQLFGNLIHMYFMGTPYWNYGAAMAFIMLIIVGVAMFFITKSQKDDVASLKGGIW